MGRPHLVRARIMCVTPLLALAALFAAPTANAESACVLSGQTPEQCDQTYLKSLATSGYPFDPQGAIVIGHQIVDSLAASPTRQTFDYLMNRIVQDSREPGHCPIPGRDCGVTPVNPELAVSMIRVALRFYGPPGLEQQINQVMTAG